MKKPTLLFSLALLACTIAGCGSPNSGGSAPPPDRYGAGFGSCYNPGLGPGYSRDYSYGGNYVAGNSRRC